jgi:hypothetical protein
MWFSIVFLWFCVKPKICIDFHWWSLILCGFQWLFYGLCQAQLKCQMGREHKWYGVPPSVSGELLLLLRSPGQPSCKGIKEALQYIAATLHLACHCCIATLPLCRSVPAALPYSAGSLKIIRNSSKSIWLSPLTQCHTNHGRANTARNTQHVRFPHGLT